MLVHSAYAIGYFVKHCQSYLQGLGVCPQKA